MNFGIAELEGSGWLLRSEVTFDDLEEAIALTKEWAVRRGKPFGVAALVDRTLVWRSDGGQLKMIFRGTKPPTSPPPKPKP